MSVILRPRPLMPGATIGVFTPSYPAHIELAAKYEHGKGVLRRLGFRVVEGDLTARGTRQGYRSGPPEERARELTQLFQDPEIDAIIATIGGYNSSSLIPFLDFEEIRINPKVFCGYSDVTSLQMAILARAGLSTFYGPAVAPSFGDWPSVDAVTLDSFLDATQRHQSGARGLVPPARWSNHFRDARTMDWCTQARRYEDNTGWRTLVAGRARGPAIVANLNTLLTLAGTDCFPDLRAKVLFIEQMDARLSREERQLRQLEAMGALDQVAGLVLGKPEMYDSEGAPFGYEELVLEVLGSRRSYPVVTGFDCSHTVPMLTLAQMCEVSLVAHEGGTADLTVCEPMVRPV